MSRESYFKPGDWVQYGELNFKVIEGGKLQLNPIQSIVPDWKQCKKVDAQPEAKLSEVELEAWETLKYQIRTVKENFVLITPILGIDVSCRDLPVPVLRRGRSEFDIFEFRAHTFYHNKERIQVWRLED